MPHIHLFHHFEGNTINGKVEITILSSVIQ